jgi:hypothetical protein
VWINYLGSLIFGLFRIIQASKKQGIRWRPPKQRPKQIRAYIASKYSVVGKIEPSPRHTEHAGRA